MPKPSVRITSFGRDGLTCWSGGGRARAAHIARLCRIAGLRGRLEPIFDVDEAAWNALSDAELDALPEGAGPPELHVGWRLFFHDDSQHGICRIMISARF